MRRTEIIFWAIILVLAVAANLLRAYLKLDIPTIYVIAGFGVIGLVLWWVLVRPRNGARPESQT